MPCFPCPIPPSVTTTARSDGLDQGYDPGTCLPAPGNEHSGKGSCSWWADLLGPGAGALVTSAPQFTGWPHAGYSNPIGVRQTAVSRVRGQRRVR